ncbi:MAG: carboxypeptidase-like regulatory domain-containing protein, partial [Saprospiraceae bacterium]|nr:carboxypeptidase-like regulatory domain-containing protein [Saprospiraceae bacterium]
ITRQSGADFAYNSRVVDPETVVSFEVENAGLDETLDLLCRKIGVVYTLVEGQVVLNFAPPGSGKEVILSGFLSDRATGDDLIGATVAVKGSQRGTFTNEFGYYALPLPQGKYTISYSYLGYQAVEMELDLQADTRRQVALPPTPVGLPEVIVRLTPQKLQAQSSPGEITLAPELLNDLPEFGGESGLIKGLASLPGIQTHSDGSAFFYARGGERDQNLIVIDDAPIYNPSHLLGFYSLVIPDFAKQITVYKSDMPASMGDRLASIVSIRTKDGNLNEAEFSGSLNPLLTRLSASLPIVKERSSVFVSLRGSNFQWLYQNANS